MTCDVFCVIIVCDIYLREGGIPMNTSKDIAYSHNTPCVVALGCFDGVHLGHTSGIKAAKRKACELSLPCCVWSFSEPPKRFYVPELVPLLSDAASKSELIEKLGVDIYISVDFNESIAALSSEDFFETILLKNLKASAIVCGFDFTFGKGGKGNSELLSKLCEQNNIEFIAVSSVDDNSSPVSSSRIREHLSHGEIEKANKLLGRYYSISSEVVGGKRLGRNLGFPTINQKIDKNLCIPANGVYLTRVSIDSSYFYAITNVGTQPTVGGSEIIAETNIFDFFGNLYGKVVSVEFLSFLRFEQKFDSIETLSNQVHSDINKAKEIIKQYKKCAE